MIKLVLTILFLISLAPAFSHMMPLQAGPVVPDGFGITIFYQGLTTPTSMAWEPDGGLYVAQQGGEIIELVIGSDGFPTGSTLVAKVSSTLLGLVFVGQDLYVSYTGSVAKLSFENGKVSAPQIIQHL